MKAEIRTLCEDFKRRLEKYVLAIVGPKGRKMNGETITLAQYDSYCDEFYLAPFKVLAFIVDDECLLVSLEDESGEREESYLRDFSIGDIVTLTSLL